MINMKIDIYTDGSCSGNPGPGGLGIVILAGNAKKEISIGYEKTTNNRMELLAVIEAFKFLNRQDKIKATEVNVYSDSAYVINTFEKKWINAWQRLNWNTQNKGPVKNVDLWKALIKEIENYSISWIKVKGHSDNFYNNRCDKLAVAACKGENLIVDVGYGG
jgi:ribonuclease HI